MSHYSRWSTVTLFLSASLAAACTFGGGSGPDESTWLTGGGTEPAGGTTTTGGSTASGGSTGSGGSAASGGGTSSGGDAASGGAASGGDVETGGMGGTDAASGGVVASGGGSVSVPSDAGTPGGGACGAARPAVTGCDPALGTGCPAEMQCAVDTVPTTPTGYCVFSSPMDGGTCFASGVTESCPAQYYCAFNECREICLCHSDCSTGRCCGDPLGVGGFRLCGDC